jgi:hypothetical protein
MIAGFPAGRQNQNCASLHESFTHRERFVQSRSKSRAERAVPFIGAGGVTKPYFVTLNWFDELRRQPGTQRQCVTRRLIVGDQALADRPSCWSMSVQPRYIPAMTVPTRVQQLAWMSQWRSAAVALARVRAEELVKVDLARIASDLEDASLSAARVRGQRTTSGLITQQRIFLRSVP